MKRIYKHHTRLDGGIGRHRRLKISRLWRAGSSPAPGSSAFDSLSPIRLRDSSLTVR